jgi:PAS domain S-box-containing protein
LILEDRPADAELMVHALCQAGFAPTWHRVETEADYLAHLPENPDAILADYTLPQFDALRALHLCQEHGLDIPFIVVTGSVSEEAAVACMKQGAADYLLKDRLARLGSAVQRVLREKHLRDEKWKAAVALRESEARYRSLVEASVQGMCIHQDGIVQFANPAMAQMLGYDSPHALIGQDFRSVVAPSERTRLEEDQQAYLQGAPAPSRCEYQGVCKDGRLIWLECLVAPVMLWQGKPAILVTCMDITARKYAEAALAHQAQELARSNAELEQFAYVASHDLKAPLRAIDHLAQWIAEDVQEALPDASRKDLALLRQRVDRMGELLDSLLAYSRIGRDQNETEVIDMRCLIQSILSLLEIPETFTISVASDLPVLPVPKAPVELVLRNLIGNALKHHDRADGRLEISWRDLGDAVEVIVADDGPGISPAYHTQIFQMFQTLKPRDQVEGSGMGLALVKKTVEHHGGTIRVESEEREGARFCLTWPKHHTRRT